MANPLMSLVGQERYNNPEERLEGNEWRSKRALEHLGLWRIVMAETTSFKALRP